MAEWNDPKVIGISVVLYLLILVLLWKFSAWGMKEKIMISVAMLPIIYGITFKASND